MGELQKVLAGIKSKVSRYGKKGVNEQNTKATLIQPVLRSLGWDVEDLDDVHLEYKRTSKDKPVDYALLLMRTPCLFVEAKALGQNLDDRKWANQILGYASVAGVEWVVLTDGNEYRIYNSHATVPVEEKLFRKVCISDDSSNPADTLALLAKARMEEKRIDRLWAAHFIDRQVQAAVQELFATDPDPDAAFVRLLRKKLPSLTPNDIKAGLRRAEVRFEFPPTADLPEQKTPTRTGRSEAAKKSWETRRKAAKTDVDASPSRPQPDHPVMTSKAHVGVSLLDVINAGLLKVPLKLTKHYKGHDLEAKLQTDGTVVFQGENFRSCSAAAEVARGTVIGGTPSTNGWTFWKHRDADGNLVVLDVARQEYIKRK